MVFWSQDQFSMEFGPRTSFPWHFGPGDQFSMEFWSRDQFSMQFWSRGPIFHELLVVDQKSMGGPKILGIFVPGTNFFEGLIFH